jgi:sec-independent protein translocase protein TatA
MLSGWEWIIIGVVAIVIIMWGPSKIPEIAKSLGKAKGEFSKAQKEFEIAALETELASTTPKTIRSRDKIMLSTAHNLGISTEDKSREQISEEIAAKIKQLGNDTA